MVTWLQRTEGFRTRIIVWSSREPTYPTLTQEWPQDKPIFQKKFREKIEDTKNFDQL